MKEKPIIFDADSVRAILAGTKTQTRRVMKPQTTKVLQWDGTTWIATTPTVSDITGIPPYSVGQRLWVRETCYLCGIDESGRSLMDSPVLYAADGAVKTNEYPHARSPIHMPRCASRITLEVLSIRPERLQDISEEDAVAEGIEMTDFAYSCSPYRDYSASQQRWCSSAIKSYSTLWNSLNACRGHPWSSNPWVWRVEFRRVKP